MSNTDPSLDETMEAMVQQASIPNLATLFKKAKAKGVIEPVQVYGGDRPSSAPREQATAQTWGSIGSVSNASATITTTSTSTPF